MSVLLQASQISFAYTDKPVLREISISLSAGEIVALLGPNGSGKTTLIRALLGHLQGSGKIEWDGRELRKWSRKELARRVAYLPQSPTIESDQRVGDVLRLGRAPYWQAFGLESPRDAEVVQNVARLLNLTDLLDRRIESLSGGQRQRVFVGRCLVQEPAALLLDEPSTFLDLKHQIELGSLLKRLAAEEKLGVLMASHDLNLAGAIADRIVLLQQGSIASHGTPDSVMRPETLEAVYGVKLDRIERGPGKSPVVFPDI